MTNRETPLRDEFRHVYIIGKALNVAIQEMLKVPIPYREVSDITDMQTLLTQVYNQFPMEIYDETLKAVKSPDSQT